MGRKTPAIASEGYARLLSLEEFHALEGKLTQWRRKNELLGMDGEKKQGGVLPFIVGLRLSAELIYTLRQRLSGFDVEVDWGHLLDDSGRCVSPECDIIIHKPGAFARWNGDHKDPVMNFCFIERGKCLAVVSCKSFAKRIDTCYCEQMKPYQGNVLLFAECCCPGKDEVLREKAKEAGYKGFWYLYTFDPRGDIITHNEVVWLDFLKAVYHIVGRRGKARK